MFVTCDSLLQLTGGSLPGCGLVPHLLYPLSNFISVGIPKKSQIY
jgi:hypothetical protein